MRFAADVKGELARIEPALACCRRAELEGLLFQGGSGIRTLDPSTARVAMRLGAGPATRDGAERGSATRHHLAVMVPQADLPWRWGAAADCDRRAFMRGVVLGSGSLSFSTSGPHVEFVFRRPARAGTLRRRLASAEEEISHAPEFDYVIINKDFDVARQDLQAIIRVERLRKARTPDTP